MILTFFRQKDTTLEFTVGSEVDVTPSVMFNVILNVHPPNITLNVMFNVILFITLIVVLDITQKKPFCEFDG